VAHLFDRFASSFDANLADLSYKAPEWVADDVARRVGAPRQNLVTLDAGCGTGLCGPLLAPYASRLVGVDLSVGMLRRAADRGHYTDLFKAELVTFLLHSGLMFELIVSADTLCYFGNLQAFASAAKMALQPGGAVVFTVEALSGEAPETGYRLHTHGRYSHSDRYVQAALQDAGLDDVTLQAVVLRNEGDTPVDGWLVSALAPRGH
jgi:predicted TPR repeat methyltransferase